MPTKAQFIKRLALADWVIKNKTEGLTHADSMRQFSFPSNCLNWNLGHLLVFRVYSLGAIDGASQPEDSDVDLYGFGSEPLTDSDMAIPLETLLARLEEASAKIVAALEAMPEDRLAEVIDQERGTTVDDRLDFNISFHEGYHLGQIEICRELALAQRQT